MARFVHEIANSELFSVEPRTTVADARVGIVGLKITAAPVLDEDSRPLGVVSLRDMMGAEGESEVSRVMSSPAIVIGENEPIEEAARVLSDADVHRLIVVDRRGRAVGVVSAIDLVRALVGIPVRFPAAFPHRDDEGYRWTDPGVLDPAEAERAPDGPGLLVLIYGGAQSPEVTVWAETCQNVRTRLSDILAVPQDDHQLAQLLERGRRHLRFRAAAVSSAEARTRILHRIRGRMATPGPVSRPASTGSPDNGQQQ